MIRQGLAAILCLGLLAGCASDQGAFSGKTTKVQLKHRIPSK